MLDNMLDKMRKPTAGRRFTVKNVTAIIIFGAIIIVFALWGVSPNTMGGANGVAAVVNGKTITLQEFHNRFENVEQNARMLLDQLPPAQRESRTKELRRRVLEDLVLSEVVYQTAQDKGIRAADGEVRDYILQIPQLKENGRFRRERYQMLLANMRVTSEDFERQIRKQVVAEKLQNLFIGSAAPSREELSLEKTLSSQKLNLRFAQFSEDDLAKPGFISDADVSKYLAEHKADVEKYYKDNTVEFSVPEQIQARHILIRTNGKRSEADALKLATQVRKEVTSKNFAKLAEKYSEDPGSKTKGGELGSFERGRMVPEFEKAAFALKSGEISQPVKTDFGYHIIYVEKKQDAHVEELAKVQSDIARKLLVRSQQKEIVGRLHEWIAKSDRKALDAAFKKADIKWVETGEFDLATPTIPKMGENQPVVMAVVKHGRAPGLLPDLVESKGMYYVVDLVSWKDVKDAAPAVEGQENMLAYRKSSDIVEGWARQAESKARIERNLQILR